MIVLGIDTCEDVCAAAIVGDGETRAHVRETMARGHQERLAPLVAEALGQAGLAPASIDAVAVTRGPGSFTGLRIGLAFGRAFALARARPCLGVGAFETMAGAGLVIASQDARRGAVWFQAFEDGRALGPPEAAGVADAGAAARRLVGGRTPRLRGSGAFAFAAAFPDAVLEADARPDAEAAARIVAGGGGGPPAPLYLRGPDARAPA